MGPRIREDKGGNEDNGWRLVLLSEWDAVRGAGGSRTDVTRLLASLVLLLICIRIFFIHSPPHRVVDNILSGTFQFPCIPEYTLIEVSLPKHLARRA